MYRRAKQNSSGFCLTRESEGIKESDLGARAPRRFFMVKISFGADDFDFFRVETVLGAKRPTLIQQKARSAPFCRGRKPRKDTS
jgi:hypothetical protein